MMPPLLKRILSPAAWLYERLPDAARPYARLMRLDKPAGTWLLLIPCWWSVALASHSLLDLWLIPLFGFGAVVMRGAGCVINDIWDRKLDAQVERTRDRPLASGEVKLWQALVFLAVLLALGLGTLLALNRFTVGLGVSSLLLVATYPLMKRITWWPQLFLGVTFNWGALVGWSAVTGMPGLPTVPLYIGGIFWTLGYDTIYAYQDIRDDEKVGIRSTARLFGAAPLPWVALFYAAAILFMMFSGTAAGLGHGFYYGILAAALFAAVQLTLWRVGDAEDCRRRFAANRDFGLIVLAAILLGKLT